jgi:HD-GYP domain-containing protein (c-di-GMP phosphodiesterase class II)
MKLSPREVDDIRVAALMHDMENIEITARVIRKAMGEIETEQFKGCQHTFHGTDLVHSLGSVLNGAFPLLLDQSNFLEHGHYADEAVPHAAEKPLGAKIIRTVRAYDALVEDEWGPQAASCDDVIEELRRDTEADHDPAVLDALKRALAFKKESRPEESALVEV